MKTLWTKTKLALSAATVSISVFAPASAWSDTLAAALTDAYKNSGLLAQNRALLRAADEDVAQAVAALRPVVSWAAEAKRTFGSASAGGLTVGSLSESATLGLSVSQTLWDAGARKTRIEMAKEGVLSTRQALVSVEQGVLLQAVDAYTRVRTGAETVALRQNNVRVITEELRAAKDRFDVGEVTRTDVDQAEARLAQGKALLAQAQGDLTAAQEYFLAAVGRRAGQLATPPAAPVSAKSSADAKAIALQNHPDILRAKHAVALADLGVKVAEASMKPTISVTGSYGLGSDLRSDATNEGGSISLNASGPVYAGGAIASAVRQAILQRDAARAALHLTSVSVTQNAGTAFASLQVARASREASDRQVRFARVAFNGVREEASLGARTTLDVLNAEQELLNAQANLITSVANEYLASYALLSDMGLLTASSLRLNVPRYDVAGYYNQVKTAPAAISAQGKQLDKMLRRIGKE